jgi:dephospho-CoA kinase
MLVIGLTGGIASGKSTLSRLLRQWGVPVVDADAVARLVVQPGAPAHGELVEVFGPGILEADQSINRRRLGCLVFSDEQARERVNAITHPRVIAAILAELSALREQGAGVAVVEAPLLIESGMVDLVDEVWVVAVDEATQLERLMRRDRCSLDDAKKRVAAQLPLGEKLRHAHRIIDNSGTEEETFGQVTSIWRELRRSGKLPATAACRCPAGRPGETVGK